MRILFPAETSTSKPTNPFLIQLVEGLSKSNRVDFVGFGCEVLHWDSKKWDVVHFQWPEAFFSWRKPDAKALSRAEASIVDHKRRGGVIVTTVHNHDPKPDFEEMGERVFELIYSNSDCFIHLGKVSREVFLKKYASKSWVRRAKHVVFYHGDYEYYNKKRFDFTSSRIIQKFNGYKVVVFGALRDPVEEKLAREAFKAAGLSDDSVLVFAGVPSRSVISKDVLAGKHDKGFGNILRLHKRIPDEAVAPIIQSADVVLIPRKGRLNSGVVPLAFTYGVPVVAPNEGVMAEMIRQGWGELYSPGCYMDAAKAIRTALEIDDRKKKIKKDKLERFMKTEMSWPVLAKRHLMLYGELLAGKKRNAYDNLRGNIEFSDNHPSTESKNGKTKICFTIALNGYDKRFAPCIDSHIQYCLRRGYRYWCIRDAPWVMTPKQCAWLKVEIMRGVLSAGADMCGFLDSDCEFRPHAPAFEECFNGKSLIMARGKSGRINSGIMFARNDDDVLRFLEKLIKNSDKVIPKINRTAYENGHFIHYGEGEEFIGEMDHFLWNNNSVLDGMSYVQHYSGGELRKWWEDNCECHISSTFEDSADVGGKPDVTGMAISDFLSMARNYYIEDYKSLVSGRRRLVF